MTVIEIYYNVVVKANYLLKVRDSLPPPNLTNQINAGGSAINSTKGYHHGRSRVSLLKNINIQAI